MASKTPEHFCTLVRKVEPIGADCVRIYCGVVIGGKWRDKLILDMPIAGAIAGATFIAQASAELFSGTKSVPTVIVKH